jgi:hypothetical protein
MFVFVDDIRGDFAIDDLCEDGQMRSSGLSVMGHYISARWNGETAKASKISNWP